MIVGRHKRFTVDHDVVEPVEATVGPHLGIAKFEPVGPRSESIGRYSDLSSQGRFKIDAIGIGHPRQIPPGPLDEGHMFVQWLEFVVNGIPRQVELVRVGRNPGMERRGQQPKDQGN